MSTEIKANLGYIAMGVIASSSIGGLVFQALGALVVGFLGALGSYLFVKFIKPKFDSLIDNLKKKCKCK